MYQEITRPFSEPERKRLQRKIAAVPKRDRKDIVSGAKATGILLGACWLLVVFFERDVSIPIVTALFAGVWLLVTTLVVYGDRRTLGFRQDRYRELLEHGHVHEILVRADEVVVLEEVADFGEYFAFQTGDNEIAIVGGQDFRKTARFPSTDFSVVDFVSKDGESIEGFVTTRGQKLMPIRVIDAKAGEALEPRPGLLPGRLDRLEDLIRRPVTPA